MAYLMWPFVLKIEYWNNLIYSLNCFLTGIHKLRIKLRQPQLPQPCAVEVVLSLG